MKPKIRVMLASLLFVMSIISSSIARSEDSPNCQSQIVTCKALLQKAAKNLEDQQATIDGLADAARAREAVITEQDRQLKDAQKSEKQAYKYTWTAVGLLLLKVLVIL